MKILCICSDPVADESSAEIIVRKLPGNEVTVAYSLEEAQRYFRGSSSHRYFDAVLADQYVLIENADTIDPRAGMQAIIEHCVIGVVGCVCFFAPGLQVVALVGGEYDPDQVIEKEQYVTIRAGAGFILFSAICGNREVGRDWRKLLRMSLQARLALSVT